MAVMGSIMSFLATTNDIKSFQAVGKRLNAVFHSEVERNQVRFLIGKNSSKEDLLLCAKFKRVTHLDLTDSSEIKNRHLKSLGHLILISLDLTRCKKITRAVVFKDMPLTSLNLRRTNVTDANLRDLQSITSLTDLDLRRTKISDEGLFHLRSLKLTSLSLHHCDNITDAGLIHLPQTLKELSLILCNITDVGMVSLKNLPLERLYLSATNITDAGVASIQEIPINILYLSGVNITDAGFVSIQQMPLVDLDLSSVNLSSASFICFQQMALVELSLSRSNISDDDLVYLQNNPLEQLDLSYCDNLTGNGFSFFKEMNLLDLDLTGCERVTNASLAYIQELPKLKKLKLEDCSSLTITYQKIWDEISLEDFRGFRFLRKRGRDHT